jgi:hypothetical protein
LRRIVPVSVQLITPAIMGPAYFREAADIINAAAAGPHDPAKIVDVLRRHGMTAAVAPPAWQAVTRSSVQRFRQLGFLLPGESCLGTPCVDLQMTSNSRFLHDEGQSHRGLHAGHECPESLEHCSELNAGLPKHLHRSQSASASSDEVQKGELHLESGVR